MRLRPADAVAWVEDGDEPVAQVALALVPQGPPVVLRGSSALIWRAAVVGGTVEEVVARVAEASGQPADVVDDDVRDLLGDLVSRGLLVSEPWTGQGSSSRPSR